MDVKFYRDLYGNQYREIISPRYREIIRLAFDYKHRGARVWVNPFDLCQGTWMLTILERKVTF